MVLEKREGELCSSVNNKGFRDYEFTKKQIIKKREGFLCFFVMVRNIRGREQERRWKTLELVKVAGVVVVVAGP